MRAVPLCAAVVLSIVSHAQAQWRQLGFAAQLSTATQPLNSIGPNSLGTPFASVSGRLVFDTAAAPVSTDGVELVFAVQDHDVLLTTVIAGVGGPRSLTPANSTARLVYNASTDSLSVEIDATEGEALAFRLHAADPAGPFDGSMGSLPESGYEANGGVFSTLHTLGTPFQAVWLSANAVFPVGVVQYAVTEAAAPPPRACSPADLTAPFGVLNFFDLVAYLDLLQQGCP